MQFFTRDECVDWAEGHGYPLSRPPSDAATQLPHITIRVPAQPSYVAFCRAISNAIEPRFTCLLWIVQHGVWPSSENWHLYYRLRASYGDHRLLHDAPGHLFLDFEAADLVTFLQVTLASGWDAEILPQLAYGGAGNARVFISHDEFVLLAHRDESVLQTWRTLFEPWSPE